jgi:hypothetical protein
MPLIIGFLHSSKFVGKAVRGAYGVRRLGVALVEVKSLCTCNESLY